MKGTVVAAPQSAQLTVKSTFTGRCFAFDLHCRQLLGVYVKPLALKNSRSPAVKTNSAPQCVHFSSVSTKLIVTSQSGISVEIGECYKSELPSEPRQAPINSGKHHTPRKQYSETRRGHRTKHERRQPLISQQKALSLSASSGCSFFCSSSFSIFSLRISLSSLVPGLYGCSSSIS